MSRLVAKEVVVYHNGTLMVGKTINKGKKSGRVVYDVALENGKTLPSVPLDDVSASIYIKVDLSNKRSQQYEKV